MGKPRKTNTLRIPSYGNITKKYGSGLASKMAVNPEDLLWLPSRVLAVNYALGGGLPYGKILEIYGEESSGKTLLATDFGVCAQKLGGVVLYNDAEHAFDTRWVEKQGLDLSRVELFPETKVELVSDWLMDMVLYHRSKLTNNEPIVFIQDSMAALDTIAKINSGQEENKAEMGGRAKAIYEMLRIRNELLSDLGVCSIFINQIRKKIGASNYEDPDTTPGGGAMKFYASQRLGLYTGQRIKEKIHGFDERVGNFTSIRVKKNKVAPPKPTFKGQIFYHEDWAERIGFNPYYGLAEVLERAGAIKSKRGIYKDNDGNVLMKGEDNFNEALAKDSKLRKKLIELAGINTLSKTRAKLEAMEGNRFPIKGAKNNDEEEDDE
jgi:recombination protein RecA